MRKTIVGLEAHVQLNTDTKLFCGCPTKKGLSRPWVRDYLHKKKISFEFVEHGLAMRCADSARERGLKLSQIAKALVYIHNKEPILFILSGDRRVNEQKASSVLGSPDLRMANPEEVLEFTGCAVGAVPPTIEKIRKIVDKRLLENDLLSFNAGNHRTGIKIGKEHLLKVLDNYAVADVSSDEVITEKPRAVSKGFSDKGDDEPNTRVCEICLGMPGSKPRLNKKALDYALKVALALNCEINKEFFFSRKTYFYPDLSKNFQITQYEIPVGIKGFVELDSGKKVGITRVHLEEDPASLVHGSGISSSSSCLVDYNRSGIPLVEIVTEPDMDSPEEAREFLNKLQNTLQYLGVFVLGEDTLKCDSNISIEGSERVEIKNVSGFRNVEKALSYEQERQKKLIEKGEKIILQTRGFDEKELTTYFLRSKEEEADYGYIFEPDLTKIVVDDIWLNRLKKDLPEMPEEKAKRFVKDYKITSYEAKVLCSDYSISKFYEETSKGIDPVLAARFISRELLAILNRNDLTLADSGMKAKDISDLLKIVEAGKVSEKNAKESLIKYALEKILPKEFLQKNSLLQDLDDSEVISAVEEVLKKNPQAKEDYKKNPDKVLNFVTGQVMRLTKGKAQPKEVNALVKEKLEN